MDISILELIILGLSSFRLTRLLVFDKITAFIRTPFIDEIEEIDENGNKETYLIAKSGIVRGFLGELLSCYWCTGIWSSIALCTLYMTAPSFAIPVLLVLAVAGFGAIIESIIQLWI